MQGYTHENKCNLEGHKRGRWWEISEKITKMPAKGQTKHVKKHYTNPTEKIINLTDWICPNLMLQKGINLSGKT